MNRTKKNGMERNPMKQRRPRRCSLLFRAVAVHEANEMIEILEADIQKYEADASVKKQKIGFSSVFFGMHFSGFLGTGFFFFFFYCMVRTGCFPVFVLDLSKKPM